MGESGRGGSGGLCGKDGAWPDVKGAGKKRNQLGGTHCARNNICIWWGGGYKSKKKGRRE